MNQDSSLLLPHWIKPAGSLLIPSFCGSPSVNPVHPPSSIAPTTETLGPSIILAHQYSQSPQSTSWSLHPPLADLSFKSLVSRFQFPAHFNFL
ncbi:hypothetical protein CHARACLAT_002824 [Characodon lateralis]|uniref:Uncharacterized protein n=1 Tax=Characodon lateralis TaxID=208331 RepID=A0ABU7EQF0_9TELE|nr:hypothetical protein [Characodon lateralis]